MSMPVSAGEVIHGKYRVERVLGAGGMGVVLAAWDSALERRVAIKVLQPELLEHPEIVQRFLREARAAARIQSDHVAQIVEVSLLDDGSPFMVMEYLEGDDLSRVARGDRGLPVEAVVSWVIEACRALVEAHRLGIVHRDLKPANLFLARRPDGTSRIKVLDFGISKLNEPEGSAQGGLTHESTVMGSPGYMSPEQMLSARDVDARTDIWSLGVILYELCTGQVPHSGETVTQIYASVMSGPATSPRRLRHEIPPQLDAVIMSCLAVDRDKRMATVSELIDRLTPSARGGKPARARPWWPFVLAGAVLAGAVVVGIGLSGPPRPAPTVEATMATAEPPPTGSVGATSPAVAPIEPTSAPSALAPPVPPAFKPSAATVSSILRKPPGSPPAVAPAKPVAGSCDPPYTVNAAGHRTIKPECNK